MLDLKNYISDLTDTMRIAYCDHSFHSKTASTQFLPEILRRRVGAQVDFFWDSSWEGGAPVIFSQLLGYDLIILFQSIPSGLPSCVARSHANVILIPMLDQLGIARGPLFNLDSFWKPFRGSKVLSFSTAVNAIATSNGIASKYFQYMPDVSGCSQVVPGDYCLSDGLRVFFWLRRPADISCAAVATLLSAIPNGYSIHIHLAVDPGETTLTEQDVRSAFPRSGCRSITISRWLDKKSDLVDIVHQSDVFIGPRLEEGIGQAFLEALAAGLCIVAPNNGTMNEYLINGVNGLLYDPSQPAPLNFEDISLIRRNTLHTAKVLSRAWKANEDRLVDYLLKPSAEFYHAAHKYHGIHYGEKASNRARIMRLLRRAKSLLSAGFGY